MEIFLTFERGKIMQQQKYHIGLKILHWLMGALLLGMIGLGWYMAKYGEKLPNRGDLYSLHKSIGVTLLLLVMLRIVFRISTKIPPLPESIPSILRTLSRCVQYTMYLLMVVVPVFGYAMSNSAGFDVKLFGITLPKIFPTDKEAGGVFREGHEILAYSLLVLVLLHIAGVIKHRFFDKKENDVLESML